MKRVGRLVAVVAVVVGTACASSPGQGGPVGQGIGETASLMQVDAAAEAAYREGRHGEAIEGYETLVRQMPTDAGYWYRLGNAYFRGGRFSEATLAYEQSLSIDASNARAWHNLGIALATQARDAFAAGVGAAQTANEVSAQSRRMGTAIDEMLSGPARPTHDEFDQGGTRDETLDPKP